MSKSALKDSTSNAPAKGGHDALEELANEGPFALVLSVVGGGVIDRLAAHLVHPERGQGTEVSQVHDPKSWREQMSKGRRQRLKARFDSFVKAPLVGLKDAVQKSPDTLVVTTNPFALPWALLATRPLHGIPVVPLIYDLYPEALEGAGMTKEGSLLVRAIVRFNRYMIENADGVVFIGPQMKDSSDARYGEAKRSIIIETGADPRDYESSKIGGPKPESELEEWCEGKTVFSYVGNLGHVHDWETLKSGIVELSKSHEGKVAFVIAASGPGRPYLEKELAECSKQSVRFTEPLPDRDWARLLRRTDVALVTLAERAKHTSIPSKTFSALAAGCAILGVVPEKSDVARVIKDNEVGDILAPGDVLSFVRTARRFIDDDARTKGIQKKAKKIGAERYGLEALGERFSLFLKEIADEHQQQDQGERYGDTLKRAIDVIGASAGIVALAPVMAGTALAVAVKLGRPVLFVQDRAGKEGEPFPLYKFRSMRDPKPGEEGPDFDDKRIPPLGHFLRNSSLDELPSLLNVLKGEMSLVGPRPLLLRYVDRYSEVERERLDMKPGVTGWAQVHGRNAISWGEKFARDRWYKKHRSVLIDARVIARTILQVVKKEDISQDGHPSMPEFMGSATGK